MANAHGYAIDYTEQVPVIFAGRRTRRARLYPRSVPQEVRGSNGLPCRCGYLTPDVNRTPDDGHQAAIHVMGPDCRLQPLRFAVAYRVYGASRHG